MQNKQEIFDTTTRALLAQGRPSFNPAEGTCLYRGPDGTKCAIGHLIPDDAYHPDMENLRAWADRVMEAAGFDGPTGAQSAAGMFLAELQSAHDEPARTDFNNWLKPWKAKLRRVAALYHLDTKVLDDDLADA
jgi:hypothetical protein